jgi:DNA-binding response OmpR family regulator
MNLAPVEAPEPLDLAVLHTVVLVDDEPAVLASLRRLLRNEPYVVRATTSPEIALAWVEEDGASLVVLDHRMPGLMGTKLAARIRRRSPRTVRVMLTAYPGNALVREGLAEDVQWLISKPWNGDALRLTIRRLLRDLESGAPPGVQDEAALPERRPAGDGSGPSLPEFLRNVLGPLAGILSRGAGAGLGFFWMSDAGGSLRP